MLDATSIRSSRSASLARTPVASPWTKIPPQIEATPVDIFSLGASASTASTVRPCFNTSLAAEFTGSRATLGHRLSMLLAASLMIGVPALAGANTMAAAPPPVGAILQVTRRPSSMPSSSLATLSSAAPTSSPVASPSVAAPPILTPTAAPLALGGAALPTWAAGQPELLVRVRGEVHLERVQTVRRHHATQGRTGHSKEGHGHAASGHGRHRHAPKHSRAPHRSADSDGIAGILERSAKANGVPVDLLKAVAWKESGWNVRALSFDGHHGKGLMQIDDRYHQFARTKAAFNPTASANYGARFLAQLKRQHGSWNAALKAYNGSSAYPGQVRRIEASRPWEHR